MNLGEAMTFVLRSKGQGILQDFWKEDIIRVLSDVVSNSARLLDGSRNSLRGVSLKELPGNIVSSGVEVIQISRVMPGRIKKALAGFQSDMIQELDLRNDPKEKAMLCLKVFGVLSSSTLGTFYNIPIPGKELSLGKFRIRSAFAKFLLAELVLRSVRAFLKRFLSEVEKELTDDADLIQVRYFRRILDGGEPEASPVGAGAEDPAFRMADKFRKTILNGDDESEN